MNISLCFIQVRPSASCEILYHIACFSKILLRNPDSLTNILPFHPTPNRRLTVPPRWILEPTDKAFAQGSDAKVECKADGFPKPQVTWKKAVGKHKHF